MSDQSEMSVGLESPGKSNSSSDFEKPFTRSSAKKRKRKKFKSYDNIFDDNFHEKKTHECKLCDYSSGWLSHLKDHITAIHERKKPHKCSSCDASFSTNYGLKRHIACVHEKKKPFKCDIVYLALYRRVS